MRKSQAPSQRKNKVSITLPLTPKNVDSNFISKSEFTSDLKPRATSLSGKLYEPQVREDVEENKSTGYCEGSRYFSVVYGKPSKKKHKTWDGDGTLEVKGKTAVLKDSLGKVVGQTTNLMKNDLLDGTILFVGSKEVEIFSEISQRPSVEIKAPVDDSTNNAGSTKRKSLNDSSSFGSPVYKKEKKSLGVVPSFTVQKVKLSDNKRNFEPLVLPEPNDTHQWQCNPNNLPLKPVSVDVSLCKVLRKHQREGILFLYSCITGMRDLEMRGAILADEMGLGKTLQCITLIWTLLGQGPYGGVPLLKKVLIVVPSSLVQNWKNEFIRWIGSYKIKTYVVDKNNRPKDFLKSRCPVMIISYEMYVKCHEDVKETDFDLMICDEGHRLKNNSTRVTFLLSGMSCKARILLTGTPIQNDLQEFFALVDFVNPGILGSHAEFGKKFDKPILASKEPHASEDIITRGKVQAEYLSRLTSDFILRRTQDLIGHYLPQKTDYVVFCEPTEIQKKLYSIAVNFWIERMEDFGNRDMPRHLSVITVLKKICNHPNLVTSSSSTEDLESLETLLHDQMTDLPFSFQNSSKLAVVDSVLKSFPRNKERLVLVSNFTQTLDLLAKLCSENGCSFLRFDGSTPTTQRNNIVSQFNSSSSPVRVLLLSSKAGGVGLNLIGGSRLILYDSDWNPATDLQAMARIWREGQTKNVHIYRLLTSGTIEEKIFQRQLKKTGLSESIVDFSSSESIKLSNEELRDLFKFTGYDKCLTHDSMNCLCPGDGTIMEPLFSDAPSDCERDCQIELHQTQAQTALRMNQLLQWEHHNTPTSDALMSEMLVGSAKRFINYIFRNNTS